MIAEVQQGKPALTPKVLAVRSNAAPQLKRLLNALCGLPGAHYLEIGTLHGDTLIPALYRNTATATAINDPFNPNSNIDLLRENLRRHLPGREVNVIEASCFSIDPIMVLGQSNTLINVFYYGGDHAQECYQAILSYAPALASQFVLLIDDSDNSRTRTEIDMALSLLRYREVYSHMLDKVYVGLVEK